MHDNQAWHVMAFPDSNIFYFLYWRVGIVVEYLGVYWRMEGHSTVHTEARVWHQDSDL